MGNLVGFNDGATPMFPIVFVLHILQHCVLVLGRITCLVTMINIWLLVVLPKCSQIPERMNVMCRHEMHTHLSSNCSIIFMQILSCKLQSEVYIFILLSILAGYKLHDAIHTIRHVIVVSDNVMQSNCIPVCHPQGVLLERPQLCMIYFTIVHSSRDG